MNLVKLTLALLVAGCLKVSAQGYNDFLPIGPAPIDFKIEDGRLFSELSRDEGNNPRVINLLPNELLAKSVITIDKDENISFSAIELSEKNTTYVIKTDHIKYATLPVKRQTDAGEIIGVARIGVGCRITATIRTLKKDITVTDLYELGEQARAGNLSGNLMVTVMGIESEEVTSAFPVNAEVSPTSVQAALQAMTIVKQAIYDKDTHLTPQVLEIKYSSDHILSVENKMDLAMPIFLDNLGEPCVVIR